MSTGIQGPKKRKPFEPHRAVRSLTGGERERCKAQVAWLLAVSRNDQSAESQLKAKPELAETVCHYSGLSLIHWAVKHNNRRLLESLLTEYKVDPNLRSRAGQTPLHIAAIYGRREIYNDLLNKFGAKADLMDMSGQVAGGYLQLQQGYGANSRGIHKIWQDLALDIQSYQSRCFEEQQRQQQQQQQQQRGSRAADCFDGRKKRHSLGF